MIDECPASKYVSTFHNIFPEARRRPEGRREEAAVEKCFQYERSLQYTAPLPTKALTAKLQAKAHHGNTNKLPRTCVSEKVRAC